MYVSLMLSKIHIFLQTYNYFLKHYFFNLTHKLNKNYYNLNIILAAP